MIRDMLRLRDWPIVSFSFFTLGSFAANDFGPGFVHALGLIFMVVAIVWSAASLARRRGVRKVEYRAAA